MPDDNQTDDSIDRIRVRQLNQLNVALGLLVADRPDPDTLAYKLVDDALTALKALADDYDTRRDPAVHDVDEVDRRWLKLRHGLDSCTRHLHNPPEQPT